MGKKGSDGPIKETAAGRTCLSPPCRVAAVAVSEVAITPVGFAPSADAAAGLTSEFVAAESITKRICVAESGDCTCGSSRRRAQ